MTPELESYLANLKAGDPVTLCSCHANPTTATVKRVTPAQIVVRVPCQELRYLKRNGRRIGQSSGWLEKPVPF